ncbi:MAG TPA: PilZ domain-containing protein [Nitrospira sp.]|nr:PilZ domain-containing protein [Nitrospira sp.]
MSRAPRKSRTLVRIPVEFQGIADEQAIKGKGHTLDLNVNGCRVESSTTVPRGGYLRLRLAIPKAPRPVVIGMARVRWVQTGAFGVEFIQRAAEDLPYISQVTVGEEQDKAVVCRSMLRDGKNPCTVLIVEDDPDVLHLCARTLEEMGCKILKAAGSSEALEACRTYLGPIHLLLIDLILRPPVFQVQTGRERYSRVHGHELVNHILRIRKKCQVLFMSGHDEGALRTLGIEVGGTLCLQKPFSREELLSAVNQAMTAPPSVWQESQRRPSPRIANAK